MEYRTFEKLGVSASLLGFGCMRFPTLDGKIDRERSKKMLERAYHAGVNYFDTAYPYHDGESETFTGEVLSAYPRDSFYLATKLPCWFVKTVDDAKKIFETQLERLRTDYIDFYLLHSLNRNQWANILKSGALDYVIELQKAGKIKHLGFSFHDEYEVFDEIIRYRKWDFCQLQLNYMDTEDQAGIKGYEVAEELGVPVVVMEPVKGGLLARLPEEITEELSAASPGSSTASWAMRWVASLPNVKVILSGMSDDNQLEDNLKTFDSFSPMTEQEYKLVAKARTLLEARVNNSCTDCKYCMPCPAGVDIPGNFSIWNSWGIYADKGSTVWRWQHEFNEKAKAKHCIDCGQCEGACPQRISIRENLKTLQEELDVLHW